ncbi:MAG: AAA family ATPase [Acidobacteria bacterium]|nr:AAA family ATPase [Acidobacteriota bacterium]
MPDTTEQIFIRPLDTDPQVIRRASLNPVFVPAMSGLSVDEPVYQRAKVDQLLALAKPGEVLRNLLLEAHERGEAWHDLLTSIRKLFRFELLPPDARGAHIVAEYQHPGGGPRFDIGNAGSGFQQVLMLMAFLFARPSSVLLLDEPDAHLHVILQDAIYQEVRMAAARTRSQLIVATHSEVIIDAADTREICVLLGEPRMVADDDERRTLIESLGVLSHEDIILAQQAPGVLYLEGHTDLELLKAFARVLEHPAEALLTTELFWKPAVADTQLGRSGIKASDHYESLRLVRNDLPALELLDGDNLPNILPTEILGRGFQRWRWRRYEIESYLVHPGALARFVTNVVGEGAAAQHVAGLNAYLSNNLPPPVLSHPLDDHPYLNTTKARTQILPPALTAAGLPALPYTRYHEIAALMRPDEIHPDVRETLDVIMRAFGR